MEKKNDVTRKITRDFFLCAIVKKLKEKFQRKNVNGVIRVGDKEKGGREGVDEGMTLNLNEK